LIGLHLSESIMVLPQQLDSSRGAHTPERGLRMWRGTKPFRVEWIGEPGAAIAAFDDLSAAIQHIGTLRLDQQHIVIYRDEVLWPDNVRRRVEN
jgi:hypothetical protein